MKLKQKFNSGWRFAVVNGRLAETHFDSDGRIYGYRYVKPSEYKTEQEKRWIREDTARYRFMSRKGTYRNQLTGKIVKSAAMPKSGGKLYSL